MDGGIVMSENDGEAIETIYATLTLSEWQIVQRWRLLEISRRRTCDRHNDSLIPREKVKRRHFESKKEHWEFILHLLDDM